MQYALLGLRPSYAFASRITVLRGKWRRHAKRCGALLFNFPRAVCPGAASCRTLFGARERLVSAGVAEWQTRQSQKLLGGDPRAGSTPASGTDVVVMGNAEWCNGNTGAFGASIPGSNPGSAARIIAETFLDSSTVEQAAVNRKVVGSNPTRGATPPTEREQASNTFSSPGD